MQAVFMSFDGRFVFFFFWGGGVGNRSMRKFPKTKQAKVVVYKHPIHFFGGRPKTCWFRMV